MTTNETPGAGEMTYRRIHHAAHFIGGGGQDLHEYDFVGNWSPMATLPPTCVPRDAKYHVGYIAKDGRQHWVFIMPAPLGEGRCDRCA